MKRYLPILIAVVLLVVAVPVLRFFRPQGLAVGQKAPEFSLTDFEGKQVSLGENRGHVVMINFWSSTCPPCREEMPYMQTVYDEFKDSGFTILAINVNDPPYLAKAFITESGLTFPLLRDDLKVSKSYEVQYIPKTLIVDREGIIRFITVGPITEEELRTVVRQWL